MQTPDDALALLARLGAPAHLLQHLRLVGEAGDALLTLVSEAGVEVDHRLVRLGIAVHDAGKILHPEELSGPGSQHEPAGEALMLQNGVPADIARCCISHAQYDRMDVCLEELLVALADKLWKGKRVEALELQVIDAVAHRLGKDRWDIFERLDAGFEAIAMQGDDRLARSRA